MAYHGVSNGEGPNPCALLTRLLIQGVIFETMTDARSGSELLILNREDVVRLLPMSACVPLMADALRGLARDGATVPLRTVLQLGAGRLMVNMPAALASDVPETSGAFGMKVVTVYPENHGTGYDAHQGVVILFSAEHGNLRVVADAMAITAIRTAAVSGAATQALARPDAGDLAILGAGTQARTHLEAMAVVRTLRRVRVYDKTVDNAHAFVEWARAQHDVSVEGVPSAREAVAGADIICTVTTSSTPVLQGEWIAPGAHINAVGAFSPSTRELDTAAVVRSRLFVDRRESTLAEAGEFCIPKSEGAITDAHIQGELGDVLLGRIEGRRSDTEITLFKSLGIAVEDLASAIYLEREATKTGAGVRLPF